MATIVSGEKGGSLPGASYQSYLTLSNFNTITLTDDNAGGKAPVNENPGDLGYGSSSARPYYEGVVGYIGSAHEIGIYDSRQDGVVAEYEYWLDYPIFNNISLSESVEDFANLYDTPPEGQTNSADAIALDNAGLGSLTLQDLADNASELNEVINVINQQEGANNPASVTWAAADGMITNLNDVTDVNIYDVTLGGQDWTELDLDSEYSTIALQEEIPWGGYGPTP